MSTLYPNLSADVAARVENVRADVRARLIANPAEISARMIGLVSDACSAWSDRQALAALREIAEIEEHERRMARYAAEE